MNKQIPGNIYEENQWWERNGVENNQYIVCIFISKPIFKMWCAVLIGIRNINILTWKYLIL